jgi:hypothetical protein
MMKLPEMRHKKNTQNFAMILLSKNQRRLLLNVPTWSHAACTGEAGCRGMSSLLGKTPLTHKESSREKSHVHRAKFNGRPELPGWLGKRWHSSEPGPGVAFIEGGG